MENCFVRDTVTREYVDCDGTRHTHPDTAEVMPFAEAAALVKTEPRYLEIVTENLVAEISQYETPLF